MKASSPRGSAENPHPESNAKIAQILAGARQVFLKHGLGAATTDMVQRAAGVSKSTVYAYFPSKEALFLAMVRAEQQKLGAAVGAERMKGNTLRESLINMGVHVLKVVLAPSTLALQRIIVAEAPRLPDIGKAMSERGPDRTKRELAAHLAEASQRGEIRIDDPDKAARQLLAMELHELMLPCLFGASASPTTAQIRREVSDAVDTFLRTHAPR